MMMMMMMMMMMIKQGLEERSFGIGNRHFERNPQGPSRARPLSVTSSLPRDFIQPPSQGPLSTSRKYLGYACPCMPTQAARRVGPQVNFVNTLSGGECCAATDVDILKRKQVIFRWSCLASALTLPEVLWVCDLDCEGTLLIFHCSFK